MDTVTDFLASDDGWTPSVRLMFRRVAGKLMLHQLWFNRAGRGEWRPVDSEPYPPATT
jgi:hypothetical protein